jgi:hypothetical protein
VASAGYRWYLGAQVLSLAGTMMSYTALFWLVLHIAGGGAPALAAVDAAQCLPMLLFSRRAGIIIAASGETAVFFIDAASFGGVIAVLAWLTRKPAQAGLGPAPGGTPADAPDHTAEVPAAPIAPRRFRWLLDLPRGVQAAAAMALLVGGFGLQFAVTNPLMATRVFHLGAFGFGLFGTCMAVGGIAGNYYSSRRKDPGQREFLAWALVFGAGECLAAVMPRRGRTTWPWS